MSATTLSDKFLNAVARWSGQVGAAGVSSTSATVIPLQTSTGLVNGRVYWFTLNRLTGTTKNAVSNTEGFPGLINTATHEITTTAPLRGSEGTATAWPAGTLVEILHSAGYMNRFIEGIEVGHNQDGTHKAGIITEANLILADNTTADASTTKHGLLKKLSNVATEFMNGVGNWVTAVTLDATQVLTNKTLTSPLFQGTVDGWISANESWAYASATTITVPSGAAAKYSKGDKIKLTQTTVKYFYVVAVADTVLTVTGGSDYTVANAAISANYYSHAECPIGFPDWFNWAPTINFTAGAAPTSVQAAYTLSMFKISRRTVYLRHYRVYGGAGTAVTAISTAVPIASSAEGLTGAVHVGAWAVYPTTTGYCIHDSSGGGIVVLNIAASNLAQYGFELYYGI